MSVIQSVESQIFDPLLYRVPLPHCGRYYPYGFPLDVSTNAREVLDAVVESFGVYGARFDQPPIHVSVLVSEGGSGVPPSPVLRGQRNLVTWVSDRENFASMDWRARFGYSCVTRATLADHVFFRWHFLDALIYMLLELNYYTSLHAACIAWRGAGVLLHGESGMGKSTLTYACARRGWTYVSDDGSSVLWNGGCTVLGEPHHFRFRADAPDLFPELRGRTLGRQMGSKPTIEVLTADLPISTAPESRVDYLVFLDRRPQGGARLTRVSREDAAERLHREMAAFDRELDARRNRAVDSIAALPAYELSYADYEEAARLLEQMAGKDAGQ